jgi:choline dehydrogenase-like flavoprotein
MTRSRANLMTVHLCGTVPMGEDRRTSGADSYGRVWGTANLRVNDASLLPDAPGVNPQGTVMVIAQRNAEEFLST